MWIKAKELDANTEYYIELLAKGTGKPKEELVKDIQRPKYLNAQEAVDYGIADKLLSSSDDAFEKRDYDALLAQTKAMKAQAAGPRAAPSGSSACHCGQIALDPYAYLKNAVYKAYLDQGLC
ncbi:ATP-DEPENDENT CLP PROTEASE PROTEOLYTIC SUBUNIT-RELATED PROTEIN 1 CHLOROPLASTIC [Salix koriyanagi]|nr:ATP-DEPENDENT CLP PROTEASE PROTEOLYTIC SUBUNIT-RELATED PROTEIN 1 CHLOROPLASTIC [Salix koriyanagi]